MTSIKKQLGDLKRKVLAEDRSAFLSALKQWQSEINIEGEAVNGNILITALRSYSWIEWAFYSACVLRQKGYATTILYKKSELNKLYGKEDQMLNTLREIPDIEMIDIDAHSFDQQLYDQLYGTDFSFVYDAISYDHHVEKEDVLKERDTYEGYIEELKRSVAKSGAVLDRILQEQKFHRFICYSGLISETPILLQTARKYDLQTVCLEGWAWREGHVIYNYNNPAMEYNVKGWMSYYGEWDREKEEVVDEYIGFQSGGERKDKGWLEGFYNVQLAAIDDNFEEPLKGFLKSRKNVFLLAPNVIGDSSTLNRETIFGGIKSWMKEVIDYFARHPELSLIIRAHPAEQWVKSKVKTRLGDFAQNYAASIPNVMVIKAEEKVNTFSLIPFIKSGLVWLSSVGVDLVVRGVPVICAALPKYTDLGIVEEPDSKESYFSKIEEIGRMKTTGVSDEQIVNAKKYLYTVFKGFSFPAQGKDFRAATLRLNDMPEQKQHDRFYQIITGEIPAPDELKAKALA